MLCPFRKEKVIVNTETTSEEKEYFMECEKNSCPAYHEVPAHNHKNIEKCNMFENQANCRKKPLDDYVKACDKLSCVACKAGINTEDVLMIGNRTRKILNDCDVRTHLD